MNELKILKEGDMNIAIIIEINKKLEDTTT